MEAKGRRAAPKLSRERLVIAALELIDLHGAEQLTVRRLATSLGVTPMALYWHFANKDELLDGVGDYLASTIAVPSFPDADGWEQRLTRLLRTLIDHLSSHPGAAEIAMRRLLYTEAGRRLAEAAFAALDAAGLDQRQSLLVGRHALRVAVGVATEPVFTGANPKPGRGSRLIDEYAERTVDLDSGEFPHLMAMNGLIQSSSDAKDYRETAIRVLIGGIEAIAGRA